MPTARILDHLLHLLNDKRMPYHDAIALTARRFATNKHTIELIFYRA